MRALPGPPMTRETISTLPDWLRELPNRGSLWTNTPGGICFGKRPQVRGYGTR